MTPKATGLSPSEIASRLARENAIFRISERLAGIGHFVHDIVAGQTEWSDGLHAIMGCGLEHSATLDDFLSRVDAADRGPIAEGLTGEVGAVFERDFGFTRCDDGEQRRGRLWAEVHREASGRARRLVVVMRDTTVEQAAVTVIRAVERQLAGASLERIERLSEPAGRQADGALTAAPPSTEVRASRVVSRPPGH